MSKWKILLTGSTGLLGSYLIKQQPSNSEIRAAYFGQYNMMDSTRVKYRNMNIVEPDFEQKVLDNFSPNIIIHTASIGNVDYCESHPEEAKKINLSATEKMIQLAEKYKAHLIFTSSNAVYDGKNPPYNEDSTENPLSLYGKLKLEAELLIKKMNTQWTIVRPIIMYGWHHEKERTNPVTWLIQKLSKNEKVNMVNDVFENPLFAGNLAEAIWKIIDKKIDGVFNIAGKDIVSRYDWALKIAEVFGYSSELITPVSSDFFKSLLPRPKNTSFNTEKMEKILGIRPLSLVEGLNRMKKENLK